MENTERGFITIATGSKKYYEMARTLVRSYKLTSPNPVRFGVITDNPNVFFQDFDDVIKMENPTCTYMDKIDLIKYSPYDETIFIDSDCIAFNDLNAYWDDFAQIPDFSVYGTTYYQENQAAWFQMHDVGEYSQKVKHSINLHGGIYYFRKSPNTERIYSTAVHIAENYSAYHFRDFSKPADEPVIALAMAVNGAKTIDQPTNRLCFLRNTKNLKADFFSKSLSYHFNDGDVYGNGMLIHFATLRTVLPIYQLEKRKVDYMWEHGKRWGFIEMLINTAGAYIRSFAMCVLSLRKIALKRRRI